MSEARQKFDYITSNNTAEQQSSKAVRIDDVMDTKNYIQNAAVALKDGKLPSTNQITEVIDTVQDTKLHGETNLSITGQRVAEKLDQVLDSTKRLVIDKNKDNEIQKLIHHSKLASINLETGADRKDAQKVLQDTYANLVVLARLVVTSSEFRGLLADFYNLFRDVLQENNVPGARKLPSAQEITTKDGILDQRKLKAVSREMTQDIKKASVEMAEGRKDQVYSQMDEENRRKLENVEGGSTKELANAMVDMAIQNLGQAVKPMVDHASEGNTDQAKQEGKHIAKNTRIAAQEYADEANNHIPNIKSKIQTQVKDKVSLANEAINNVKLTDEQLEMLADRLAGIVDEVKSHPEYQKALEGLLDVLYNIKQNTETAANSVTSQVKEDRDLTEAVSNAKKAVENFAGHYSLDNMVNLIKELSNKADSDDYLKKIMHGNYQFILNAFRDKKFIHDESFNEKAIDRFNTSREYLLKTYGELIKQVLTEGNNLIKGLKEDPTTNRAISDLESLTKEIFADESGRPTIKYDLLNDFHKFVPALAKRLKTLEVSRVSGEDDDIEYILDNISLTCDNILPRTVYVRTDTEFDNENDRILNAVSVKMQGVQASAKNIAFYFKKKIIIGDVEDSGTVNVIIDKEGLDVFLRISPRPIVKGSTNTIYAPDQPNFIVLDSKCRINNISVKFEHVKHNILFKLFNKKIQSTIKRQIEVMIGQNIREFLEGIDSTISAHNENSQLLNSEKSAKPLDPSPEGWKSEAFSASN